MGGVVRAQQNLKVNAAAETVIDKNTNMPSGSALELSRAYFGMQCFWGVESSFAKLRGVLRTRVGYAGGTTHSPTYRNIGDHTEVVELQFDPTLTSYQSLLDWFFRHHDPTIKHKKQYQSAILYEDNIQKESAEASKVVQERRYNRVLETYIKSLDAFYQAEDYHQKYWLRCQSSILRELNLGDRELVMSTLAAKVNAYLAGYDDFDVLKLLSTENGLSDQLVRVIRSIAEAGGDPRACH